MQDIDDVLLRKHCKEGASVVTHFWVLTKKNNFENEKIQKNISKNIRKKSKK
jgi:hypothetical protein